MGHVDWHVGDRVQYAKPGRHPRAGVIVGSGRIGQDQYVLVLFDGIFEAPALLDLRDVGEFLAFVERPQAVFAGVR